MLTMTLAYFWFLKERAKVEERLRMTRRVTRCLSLALERHYHVGCPNMHKAIDNIQEPGLTEISKKYAIHVLKEAIAPQVSLYNWLEQMAHDNNDRRRIAPPNSQRHIDQGIGFYGAILSKWLAKEEALVQELARWNKLPMSIIRTMYKASK